MEEEFRELHSGLLKTLDSAFPTKEGWSLAIDQENNNTNSVSGKRKSKVERTRSAESSSSSSDEGTEIGVKGLTKRTSLFITLAPVTNDPEDGTEVPASSSGMDPECNETSDWAPNDETSYEEFAENQFHNGASPQFINSTISDSLLPLDDAMDRMVAVGIWVNILKFMGDIPEPIFSPPKSPDIRPYPVMSRLFKGLANGVADEHMDTYLQTLHSLGLELVAPTEAGQESFQDVCDRKLSELPAEIRANSALVLPLTTMSKLEKIHYIVGAGVLRPSLRDEIYCQICKQLTANPTDSSRTHGWILLALVASCFPPGIVLRKVVNKFIEKGASDYAEECGKRLARTLENGARVQPPSWVEFQAIKCQTPLKVSVTFMDSERRTFEVDAATTAHELCNTISTKLGLLDGFGFSLYIAIFEKVFSLQSSGDHVFDAIGQCEQNAIRHGDQEHSAPWRLFYRKEIFKPWYDVTDDDVAADLIYQQVIKGIRYEEYKCDQDTDLAMLIAQHYYIKYGTDLEKDKVKSAISDVAPSKLLKNSHDFKELVKKVETAFKYNHLVHEQESVLAFKQNIVVFAKEKWTNSFSRFFEGRRIAGTELPVNTVIIAVNSNGIYFLEEKEGVLAELVYCLLKGFTCDKQSSTPGQIDTLTLTSRPGDVYIFSTESAVDILDLVTSCMDGLRSRSKYAMALKDVAADNDCKVLTMKKGELIELDDRYSQLAAKKYFGGRSEKTGCHGSFEERLVHVLPVIDRPDDELLERLRQNLD